MENTVILTYLLPLLAIASCATFDCTNRDDGIYELSCQSYVVCNSSKPTLVHCPAGGTFVNTTGRCGSYYDASYPCNDIKDCTSTPDGRYADINNGCQSYYRCYNKNFYGHYFCNKGLVFDERAQVCNYPFLVKPPCGTFSVFGK